MRHAPSAQFSRAFSSVEASEIDVTIVMPCLNEAACLPVCVANARWAASAAALRELRANQSTHSFNEHDLVAGLKETGFKIGQECFGSQKIGPAGGPLLQFVVLVLCPVLGERTPDGEALRKFAEEHRLGPVSKRPPPSP